MLMFRTKLLVVVCCLIYTSSLAQWQSSEGPKGGYLNEFAAIGSSLFISAGGGGIYRSTDNGVSWELKITGLPYNAGIQEFIESNGKLYVAIYQSGIYISENQGDSWSLLSEDISSETFYNLGIKESEIYAGLANGGAYYSGNGGVNWVEKSVGIKDMQIQDFEFFKSDIYAGSTSLFQSSNQGDTWEEVEIVGLGPNGVDEMVATETTLFLGGDGDIFTSSDGINWQKSTLSVGGSIISMGVSADSVYLTTALGSIYYTKDEGVNWTLVKNIQTSSFTRDALFLEDKILMSTSEGLYSSVNGGQDWDLANNGINALQITALHVNNSKIFAGTERQGLYISDLNGNWVHANSGLEDLGLSEVTDIISAGNTILISTYNGIYSSIDEGLQWSKVFEGFTEAMDVDNNIIASAVNHTGIYLSGDEGKSWDLAGTNGLNINTSYESLRIIGDTIVVSTGTSELYISEDLGNTWSDITIQGNNYLAYDLQFNEGKLYAGTLKGLLFSDDLGQSWQFVNNVEKVIKSIAIIDNFIFAAADDGIYKTSENRDIWYDVSDGLGNVATNKIITNNGEIFVGTFGFSVWQSLIEELNIPPIILGTLQPPITNEDEVLDIDILDLDIDDDSTFPDNFSFSIIDGENYIIENNSIVPNVDYFGTLTVPIFINDGEFDSPIYELAIAVSPVNDAPIIKSQLNPLSTQEGVAVAINVTDLVIEDVDNDFPGNFSLIIGEGDNYTVSNNLVSPIEGFIGRISVPVKVNDGESDSEEFLVEIDVIEIVGLSQESKSRKFSVYPNPVRDNLNISGLSEHQVYKFTIIGSNGQAVSLLEGQTFSNSSLNISKLKSGIYTIQIFDGSEIIVIRFFKE